MNSTDKTTFRFTYAEMSVIVAALNSFRQTAAPQTAEIAKRVELCMRDVMGDLDD